MTAIIEIKKKHKLTSGRFTIHYDTAAELGEAVAEIRQYHGPKITNPYEPDFKEFDEFNEALRFKMDELRTYAAYV